MSISQNIPAKSITNWLLIPVSVLVSLGLMMVYSASIRSWPTDQQQVYLAKQVMFLGFSISIGCLVAAIPRLFWYKTAWLWYTLTLILLVITLVPGIGTAVNGSQRWIRFAGFSFQPAELCKWTIPLLLAKILACHSSKIGLFSAVNLKIAIIVGMAVGLTGLQPDLGTALVILMVASITLFLSGWSMKYFILGGMAVLPLGFLTLALNPYQWKRIEGMISGLQNIEDAPYQVKQSVLALASGDWTGRGLGNGILKLSFLPEANNDFILAVVGEEFGVLGTLTILILWMFVLYAGWKRIASYTREAFNTKPQSILNDDGMAHQNTGSLNNTNGLDNHSNKLQHESRQFAAVTAFTLLSQIVIQALINVAVVTAIAPPKGISHPLLSYGGSNLLVSMIMLGLIHSLTAPNEKKEF